MELRCLTDDAPLVHGVQKLNLGVLPVQPPSFCYRRAERDANRLSWAAVADGVLQGAAIAELELQRDGERLVQLRTLVVASQCRRQGVGKTLVLKVIEQAKRLDVTAVRLHVHAGNEDGLAFYRAIGFQELERIDNYYRRLEPPTAFVMQYSLH